MMRDTPYGGIARQERITQDGDGPYCDKAWHLSKEPVRATCVLHCAFCARVYARCAACNRGGSAAAVSMRAHVFACHRRVRRTDIGLPCHADVLLTAANEEAAK